MQRWLAGSHPGNAMLGPGDPFLTWIEDQARPQLEHLFAPGEELLGELDISYNRINNAPKFDRRINAMPSREYRDWNERLGRVLDDLGKQKQLTMRQGRPVVLDTSVLMEAEPHSVLRCGREHPIY